MAASSASRCSAARALLDARLAPHHTATASTPVDALIAIDNAVHPVAERLCGGDDATELSGALVDLTLRQAVAGTDPAAAVQMALRLVPPTTLSA